MFGWLVVAAIAGWLIFFSFEVLHCMVYVIMNLTCMHLIDIHIEVVLLCRSLNVLFTNPIWVLVTRMQVHYLDIFLLSWSILLVVLLFVKMQFISFKIVNLLCGSDLHNMYSYGTSKRNSKH
jgi:hypothetical protein